MEVEAAPTNATKMSKLTAAREGQNAQPTPTNGRSTYGQEAPMPGPAVVEEEGVDRISDLPDEILGNIASLLPTAKDVARTQVLATRWSHVWLAGPLNLDLADLPAEDDEAFDDIVSGILSAHPGPGRRLCLQSLHMYERPGILRNWLRSPALDNLQEFDLWDGLSMFSRIKIQWTSPPPPPAVRFSATLRVASLCKCKLIGTPIGALSFPQLRQLGLDQVTVSGDMLHAMISNCPALEFLLLNRNSGFTHVRITCSSIRSVGVGWNSYDAPWCRELIMEDAPCLERVINLQPDVAMYMSVISAPKLQTLGSLAVSSTFEFGGTAITKGRRIVSGLETVVCSVKILAMNDLLVDADMVIDLIKCFPCLEKLYLTRCVSGESNNEWRKHKHLIESLDIRLKTIVLEPYLGFESHINFASFFVMNAKVLELMRLRVSSIHRYEAFFAEQHRVLEFEKRASRDARLDFAAEICPHEYLHIDHVRDLSLADPYECVDHLKN